MKRFSETSKWEDDWFISLTPIQKLVFLFMVDKCDNAGFFEKSPIIHPLMLGISLEEYLGAIKGLERGLIAPTSPDSKKLYMTNFLWHQKNLPLSPINPAHRQIIEIISRASGEFNLDVICEKLGAEKGLFSPIGIGIGKVSMEVEPKKKKSDRKTFTPPTLDDFKNYFLEEGYKTEVAERAWKGYAAADWHDAKGDPIKNWKQKLQNGWFRPENKNQTNGALSYDILKQKGWKKCTPEELEFAYKHQHRTADSYIAYPETELLVKAGVSTTRSEVQR